MQLGVGVMNGMIKVVKSRCTEKWELTARYETKERPTRMTQHSGTAISDKSKWHRTSRWLQRDTLYEVLNGGSGHEDSTALWHVESMGSGKTDTA